MLSLVTLLRTRGGGEGCKERGTMVFALGTLWPSKHQTTAILLFFLPLLVSTALTLQVLELLYGFEPHSQNSQAEVWTQSGVWPQPTTIECHTCPAAEWRGDNVRWSCGDVCLFMVWHTPKTNACIFHKAHHKAHFLPLPLSQLNRGWRKAVLTPVWSFRGLQWWDEVSQHAAGLLTGHLV